MSLFVKPFQSLSVRHPGYFSLELTLCQQFFRIDYATDNVGLRYMIDDEYRAYQTR